MSTPRTILVQRLSSIGDIVLATSPLKSIHDRFPDSRIDFMVLNHFAPIIEGHPYIDRIIKINPQESIFTLRNLGVQIDNTYDLVIDLHNSIRTKIIRRKISNDKTMVYQKPRWKRFKLFQLHKNDFADGFNQRTLYHQCIGSILEKGHIVPPTQLYVSESERKAAKKFITEKGVKNNYLTIIPGAAWSTKLWPKNHYRTVIRKFVDETNRSIVLLGGKHDSMCDEIAMDGVDMINLKGQTDLRDSLAIIANADGVLGSDTGLVHAAEALNVPAVMIMGPTSVETGGGTFLDTSTTLENPDLWCRPCSQNGKLPCYRKTQYCMTSISTDDVLSSVNKILSS